MMPFSRFIQARTALASNLVSWVGISTAGKDLMTGGTNAGRVFAGYTIFKGKAALKMEPVQPKFSMTTSGDVQLAKAGSVMLNFFPAIGQRKYDWQKKQAFALSAVELGSLISLGQNESCEFYHDPSMQTSLAGQVKKIFSARAGPDDGYLFNLNITNNALKTTERFSVPVTKAEFAVMRSAFSFILPHIMGWSEVASRGVIDGIPPKSTRFPPKLASMPNPSLEWDR